MEDLTIIFITASEIKKEFAAYQWETLKRAAGSFPIIRVTRDQQESCGDFGVSAIIYDNEPKGISNIYRQMLRAAKEAKTPYVAIAEDDTLYQADHFTFCRPPLDTFAYNQSRWALFTWLPIYNWRYRKSNSTLIAPRELLIEALEERFAKYPEGTPVESTGEVGRDRVEKRLGLTVRKSVEVYSTIPVIQFNHDNGTEERQVSHRKRMGPLRALDIPYWGPSEKLVEIYK